VETCDYGRHTASVTYYHEALGMRVTTRYHGAIGLARAREVMREPSAYPLTLVEH